MKKVLTLCLVHQKPRILLGLKKRGFGAGKWNGFGGKLQPGETIEEAAIREVKEEAGIDVRNLVKRGVMEFSFEGNPELLEIHLFHTKTYSGEPQESEEMKPQWYDERELPFDSMWPDARHWMPLFLAGNNFTGNFSFDRSMANIIDWNMTEVETLA